MCVCYLEIFVLQRDHVSPRHIQERMLGGGGKKEHPYYCDDFGIVDKLVHEHSWCVGVNVCDVLVVCMYVYMCVYVCMCVCRL
jgi:hypothetical protein